MEFLTRLDPWLANLIVGLYIVAMMAFGSLILVKARRSPIWVFLLLVPYLNLLGLWVFAYVRWPGLKRSDESDP
ncbi:MAG: hypothetical protein H6842_04420 [Rhodospirillaceae bacterium]|nr:hypothetical protein [Rhodospirillaceae bacterium]